MDDEERQQEQEEQVPRRPRVVDRRISARGASETASPGARTEETRQPAAPPPAADAPAEAAGAAPPAAAPRQGTERVWTPEQEAEAARMAQEIADTPSLEWVVNTAVTLANVAAAKLELGAGDDAQLAIDALAGVINATGPRLQQAESPLRQTLAQLQLAYAQRLAPPSTGG